MNQNVLVSCGGKWVGMILAFRQAASEVGGWGSVYVSDRDELTPAGCFADGRFRVPGIAEDAYIDAMVDLCAREGVGVVVPLMDVDMARLAPHAARFASAGAHLVSPPPAVVDTCLDKVAFQEFCDAHGLATPPSVPLSRLDGARYPLFFKRRAGFGSIGIGRADTPAEAHAAVAASPELVFQEFVDADEVSVDAYVNREGRCTVLVPRVRDKVVGGEAQRSHTIEDPGAWDLARRTVDALASVGLRGPLNVQMFLTEPRALIEVNTRLGSCTVLSNAATGGRLIRSILVEAAGGVAEGDPADYERDLWIYRYTGDVFHRGPQEVRLSPARASIPAEFVE